MTAHRTNDRPSAPQAYQCLLSHFLASLGALGKTDCTLMLWSIDSCRNRVSADQYHLTVSRAQVEVEVEYFSKLSADKLLVSNDRRLKFVFFFKLYEICCLCRSPSWFMSLWPSTIKILISNLPRTRKFSQLFKNTGGEDLFLPWSRVGHALRPIFMLWLVKIWQVSSCGKFMQHLESCLLW